MTKVRVKRTKTGGPIGLTHPSLQAPELVPFGTVRLAPDRFQVRNPRACSYVRGVMKQQESIDLGTTLLKLIEAGATLDPPVIWVDAGGSRWVIDGHHRVEAMTHAGIPADRPIHVQRFLGATEAEARDFALTINKREHLNLHRSEALNSYWLGVLCGEVVGSVRGRAKQYAVSPSTVQRMDKQRQPVLVDLQAQALQAGVEMDAAFIRTTAPVWKDLADWRDGEKGPIPDDPDRKAVERMLRTLTIRFSDQAKAQPDVLLQAFQEFFEEVTGKSLELRLLKDELDDEDDGPRDTTDF